MQYNEYRGVRGLVIAEITDGETYTPQTWQELSGVQSVAVSKNESSESKFYDNAPRIVIDAEGADEITLVVSVLANKTRALIDGVMYDEKTDMIINTPKQRKYFALGYIGAKTDGTEEFNICYKGKFTGGAETHETQTDGTESTNVEYTFTAIHTSAKILTGANGVKTTAKSIKVPASTAITEAKIFGAFNAGVSTVKPLTPDEIKALVTA
jgi:phi13 family phage major tail protein